MASGLRWTDDDLRRFHMRAADEQAGRDALQADFARVAGKPRKYRNEPVAVDGLRFDSKHEASVWRGLRARELAGEIRGLRLQVPYACVVNGVHVCDWIADFDYREQGVLTVVDAKSEYTRKLPVYRLKRKLMMACHGLEIREL